MTERIQISPKEADEKRCEFSVEVGHDTGEIGFWVKVDKEYWKELTGGRYPIEDLVQKTFEFLLYKEPKTAILREFDLRELKEQFPDYEEEMKKKFWI